MEESGGGAILAQIVRSHSGSSMDQMSNTEDTKEEMTHGMTRFQRECDRKMEPKEADVTRKMNGRWVERERMAEERVGLTKPDADAVELVLHSELGQWAELQVNAEELVLQSELGKWAELRVMAEESTLQPTAPATPVVKAGPAKVAGAGVDCGNVDTAINCNKVRSSDLEREEKKDVRSHSGSNMDQRSTLSGRSRAVLARNCQRHGFRKGDWNCPICGDHQFAKNEVCRKCGQDKPKQRGLKARS